MLALDTSLVQALSWPCKPLQAPGALYLLVTKLLRLVAWPRHSWYLQFATSGCFAVFFGIYSFANLLSSSGKHFYKNLYNFYINLLKILYKFYIKLIFRFAL